MQLNNLHVLIAEDHEQMRDSIVRILARDFKVVGAVGDGDELVTAALNLQPDVIVTDVYMPRLSGIKAQKLLREHGRNIPFVFVSTDHSVLHNLSTLGVCVPKSDLISKLNAAVRSAAGNPAPGASGSGMLCAGMSCAGAAVRG